MNILIPVVLAGAGLFFLAKKAAPGGVATQWVQVRIASGQVESGVVAGWHVTDDQIKLFGPRRPDYWSRNGYFVFGNDHYKPDWQVPIKTGSPT